jgi:hypothetical protein
MTTTTERTLNDVRLEMDATLKAETSALNALRSRQWAELQAARTQGARDRLVKIRRFEAASLRLPYRDAVRALMDEEEGMLSTGRIPPFDYAPGERQRLLRIQRDD